MPYIKIETNKEIKDSDEKDLLKTISAYMAKVLDKPEQWMMISFHHGVSMAFQGNTDLAAYVELKSIGLSEDKTSFLSKAICEFIESEIGIPANRIYIEFSQIKGNMFGWNKETF